MLVRTRKKDLTEKTMIVDQKEGHKGNLSDSQNQKDYHTRKGSMSEPE